MLDMPEAAFDGGDRYIVSTGDNMRSNMYSQSSLDRDT